LIGVAGFLSMGFYLIVGKWSDRVGRKKPIIWGNIVILITLFPAFWMLGNLSNPALSQAQEAAPVVVSGPDCKYDPFADQQATQCGRLIEDLTANGIAYDLTDAPVLTLTAGSRDLSIANYGWENPGLERREQLQQLLTTAGYDFSEQYPTVLTMIGVVAILLFLGLLSAMNYGSVAALLAEMFPAKIRYSSMSIPYHIGAGYFGGFLPLIAGYIIARTGDAYSGLWYTWIFVFIALVVGWWGIPDDPESALDEDR
jgi:MFS family permease